MTLAGVDLFLRLDLEVCLGPPLELNHVGHDLCVLHAGLEVGDNGWADEHIYFAYVLFPKEPPAALELSNGQSLLVSGRAPASDG